MNNWKTMLEVARELDITKSLVRYHRQKLVDDEVKIQDGVTYISVKGIARIKSFLRLSDYSEEFETRVKNQLNLIQELLVTAHGSTEKNTRATIEQFREYLIRAPDAIAVLYELEKQSKGTIENEFYFLLTDYIERKRQSHHTPL